MEDTLNSYEESKSMASIKVSISRQSIYSYLWINFLSNCFYRH